MGGCDPMDDAASWFIELVTAVDLKRLWPKFEEWLQRSPRNRSAFEQIERAWSEVDDSAALRSRGRQLSRVAPVLH
jgi:ferric-dicitrate binding protein FerR (iron transport regulator)